MKIQDREMNFFQVLTGFFPVNIIISQFKFNLFAILFWGILFGIVSDGLGYSFGIPFLFYSPEYLGTVSPWSFYLVGFALGGFIMGFNTYSYIKLGPHYPFLVTVNRPFIKFCINNSLIPVAFIIYYIVQILIFQSNEEFASNFNKMMYILALLAGTLTFLVLSSIYFFRISFKFIPHKQPESEKPIESVMVNEGNWFKQFRFERDRTFIYLGLKLKLHASRSTKHLDKHVVEQVYAKNRINSSVYEILTICVFFILGFFNQYPLLEVPAAMSIILLLTVFLMLFSALQSWFRGWIFVFLISALLIMDQLSIHTEMFRYSNYAYGLDYSKDATTEYSIQNISRISGNDSLRQSSFNNYLKTLENWKKQTGEEKPKLVIINTSGGGSRSALWTFTVLQQADIILKDQLTKNVHLITGASGGMIGAAYYRQLMIEEHEGRITHYKGNELRDNMGKDLLNRLSFMASTNDIFIRYQKFSYNNHLYTKDRGFAFEQQLIKNTDGVLDHELGYYKSYEKQAIIPTMIFSPTIVNDGRRLLICSQPVNFLTADTTERIGQQTISENLEYHTLFSKQDAEKIRFTSVLRASATFPFVMPMVTMPSTPEIQLMDAGIRDNYGTKTTVEFLNSMKDWIKENTSGVIILQIRDTKKVLDNERYNQVSFIEKLTLPFNNMYKNFPRVQDFNQEELLNSLTLSLNFPIDVIDFNLREKQEDRISLSWHLTTQEKIKIETALMSADNMSSLIKLKTLLK